MTEQNQQTKERILEVARVLFADYGYEGTSVRQIATAAEVNVASVNYYFNSKENLFSELLKVGYLRCANEIKIAYEEQNLSLEETLIVLFKYFLDKSPDLISYFKMMMSGQHSHQMSCQANGDEMIGPPGGSVIMSAIQKEAGMAVDEESLHWALKSLFSHVVHMSIMYNCCFKHNPPPFSEVSDIEKSIRRLTRVVVNDLKLNSFS